MLIQLIQNYICIVIFAQIYTYTHSFTAGMIVQVCNSVDFFVTDKLCDLFYQEDVVTRRTQYDLNKAQERAHILEGLLKALDNIDEVIRIIRGSRSVQIARQELMDRFELIQNYICIGIFAQ